MSEAGLPAGLSPSRHMRSVFLRELRGVKLEGDTREPGVVRKEDLEPLPATARRFLLSAGVLARPRTWSVRAHATGAFRLAPDKPWMDCEAWQYGTCLGVRRVFHMRLRLLGFVPMLVRDTYAEGRGHMLGRVMDAISVVDEVDDRVTTGELVTYLNDAIFLAPAMLLRPAVTWTEVDDGSFDVALTDHGRTVAARVYVDPEGRVTDFSTIDRWISLPGDPPRWTRARWSTPVHGWRTVHGRTIARGGRAVWHLPPGAFSAGANGGTPVPDVVAEGEARGALEEFAYADLTFDRVEFDVLPDSA
ncbi:MAG: DUF6544 family protein [Polyangiaceae bacterium]